MRELVSQMWMCTRSNNSNLPCSSCTFSTEGYFASEQPCNHASTDQEWSLVCGDVLCFIFGTLKANEARHFLKRQWHWVSPQLVFPNFRKFSELACISICFSCLTGHGKTHTPKKKKKKKKKKQSWDSDKTTHTEQQNCFGKSGMCAVK